MTPLHEHELRTELNAIDPIPDTDIAGRVVAQGRAMRARRRLAAAVAGASALAAVVLAAGQLGPLLRQGLPATPAAPTSAPPSASVTPREPDTTRFVNIPGARGVVPITLPHEQDADWTTADWFEPCARWEDTSARDRLTASKVIGRTEPLVSHREGAVVFASPKDAADFVVLMSEGVRQGCDATSADGETRRHVSIVDPSPQEADGFEDGRIVALWAAIELTGGWTTVPGGTSIVLLRTGNTVVFAAETSTSLREPQTFPGSGVGPEVVRGLEGLFPQACRVADTC